MPAHRKRPAPPTRMVDLLADQKRQLLDDGVVLTGAVFEAAWEASWLVMVSERAWPHATTERRGWRKAMEEAMKPEARACFLNEPTGFHRYVDVLSQAFSSSVSSRDVVVGQMVA